MSCAWCDARGCTRDDDHGKPAYCPESSGTWLTRARQQYLREDVRALAASAAHTERTGYLKWTRLQEIAEFARHSGATRLGLAFCGGLAREARVVADYLCGLGFEVVSAVCSVGGIDKAEVGIPPEDRFCPDGFEVMCNPVGQAMLMNEQETNLNVVLGLCVGHDSLFFLHSSAPATVLAAKDRVLGHNPLAAVYLAQTYYRRLFDPESED